MFIKNRSVASSLAMTFALCSLIAVFSTGHAGGFSNLNAPPKPPIEEFQKYLTGAKLTGVFTLDGKPLDKLTEELYEIKSAKKIDDDDNLWEIVARIKYGTHDVEVPVAINVEWAGKTPVMVMDSVTIPGMGTFSARVVFHDKKYAGTWKHDNVGGHLFGRVDAAQP